MVSKVVVVALLTERKHVMPETVQDAIPPFIAAGYTAKVVFTQAHAPERLDLRTVWQQSQGSWRHHPVFQGLPVREVIVWLRGEDSDVQDEPRL
jgi:hypothetical protein